MHLRFITPVYPPQVCGIADHCRLLAHELGRADRVDVVIGAGVEQEEGPVPVRHMFDPWIPRSLDRLTAAGEDGTPDWLIWQYDPFAFGTRYGINFRLPRVMARLAQRYPAVRQAVIVHETFLPGWSPKRVALRAALGLQLGLMARCASAVFVAVEDWAAWLRRWFPRKVVRHLPVGSNIPLVPISRDAARRDLGLAADVCVVGLFGRLGRTRALDHVRRGIARLAEAGHRPLLFYVGIDAVRAGELFAGLPIRAEGPLTAEKISVRLSAMDLYFVPIDEGVTTRRGSLMSGLQHGLPVVATAGRLTEAVIQAAAGRGLLLAPADDPAAFAELAAAAAEPAARAELAAAGRDLYQREFDWPVIAAWMRNGLLAAAGSQVHPVKSSG